MGKRGIKNKEIRVVRVSGNNEAVKIFCRNKRMRDEIWERRDQYKKEYDMFVDKWLPIKERKNRFEREGPAGNNQIKKRNKDELN